MKFLYIMYSIYTVSNEVLVGAILGGLLILVITTAIVVMLTMSYYSKHIKKSRTVAVNHNGPDL